MAFVLTGVLVAGAAAATYYFYYNQPANNTPTISPAAVASADAPREPEAVREAVKQPETAPVPAVAPKKPESDVSKKPEPAAKKPEAADIKKPEIVDSKKSETEIADIKKPETVDSKKPETISSIPKNDPISTTTIAPETKKKENKIPFASISKERSASISTTTADVILTNSTQKSAGALEFLDNYVPSTKGMSRIMASRPRTLKRKPSNWPLKKDISISEPTYENKPSPPAEGSEGVKSDGDDSAPPVATPTKPRSYTKGSIILPAGFDPKVALRGLRGSTIKKGP